MPIACGFIPSKQVNGLMRENLDCPQHANILWAVLHVQCRVRTIWDTGCQTQAKPFRKKDAIRVRLHNPLVASESAISNDSVPGAHESFRVHPGPPLTFSGWFRMNEHSLAPRIQAYSCSAECHKRVTSKNANTSGCLCLHKVWLVAICHQDHETEQGGLWPRRFKCKQGVVNHLCVCSSCGRFLGQCSVLAWLCRSCNAGSQSWCKSCRSNDSFNLRCRCCVFRNGRGCGPRHRNTWGTRFVASPIGAWR
mmetsp:Transcript_100385/g.199179  ORF Transcript_100385/g.199179 Transcript_100385/m.199179 type:complete len:251 (-) Transcript_100385:773-1525(-)